ncbi:MAG TPA: N-acetyltransferase [Candidatus Omnitrophota bacterium]|nr:N-acetyltransferase [Candidatus Omnitrophota bacterium]
MNTEIGMIVKAKLDNAKEIHKLINLYAEKDMMLPRSLNEIYENIRDFWVYLDNSRVIGAVALHVVGWDDLGEIKSLAVEAANHKKGIGRKLVDSCIEEAKKLGIKKVFALSFVPDFFKKLGFKVVDKKEFPHKIWAECCNCPKFPNCEEVALAKNIE